MMWVLRHALWQSTVSRLGFSIWIAGWLLPLWLAWSLDLQAIRAGLVEVAFALLGLVLADLRWRRDTRDAAEYWTQVPVAGAGLVLALVPAVQIGVFGGLAWVLLGTLGPLGFGWLFYFATLAWAERGSSAARRGKRAVWLPGAIGIAALLVRVAFSASDPHAGRLGEGLDERLGERLGRESQGLIALALALVAAVLWKIGRGTWGTDRLRRARN